jgi:DNA sulfur modification protein DndD
MDNIQIFELEMQDYRQYRGSQTISLETPPDSHINIIEGQNGSGKSNILNAVTLCFYGEEKHQNSSDDGELESDPLVNKRRLQDLEPGEKAEGYIEIKLGKEAPEYAFKRTFSTVRDEESSDSDETQYSSTVGDLSLRQQLGRNDWELNPNPENILREILPTHVHEYFLFDGEQLDEFFSPGYTDHVRAAVLDVSHIELLNSAVEHLDRVQRDFESESSDIGGDVGKLQQEKEKAEQGLNRLKEKKSGLEDDLETAQGKLDDIVSELAASADDQVRENQERRVFLEQRLDELEEERVDAKETVGTSLARAGGIAYNAEDLQYAISELEAYSKAETTVPGVTSELLNWILSGDECICGRGIEECDDAEQHIEQLLEEQSEEEQDVIEGRYRMEQASKKGEERVSKLLDDVEELEQTSLEINDKETELAEIAAKLEDEDIVDNERAQELERRRQNVQGRIENIQRDIGELDGKIEQQKEVVESKRDEWQQAMEEEEEHELLVEKSRFLDDATDTLSEIKNEILEQVRSDTERRLEQYYNDLIWKSEDYEVTLTEDYEVRVYGPDSRKYLGSLSAGERQVLALSFMAALSKISGFDAPIVIDTPLGRISSDPKQRIAQNVPNYLSDTQVTFLMTDVEYSDNVRAYISNEVANEYHLEFADGATEVEEQ